VLRNRLDKSELELRRALSELDEERRKTEAVLGDSDAAGAFILFLFFSFFSM